jgi:hypothetical protein
VHSASTKGTTIPASQTLNKIDGSNGMPEDAEQSFFGQDEAGKSLVSAAAALGTYQDKADDCLPLQSVDCYLYAGAAHHPDFVSKASDMKKVLTMALSRTNTSVILHRFGDSLYFDGEGQAVEGSKEGQECGSAMLVDNVFSFGLSDDDCPSLSSPLSSSSSCSRFDAPQVSDQQPTSVSAGELKENSKPAKPTKQRNGNHQKHSAKVNKTSMLKINGSTALLAQDSMMLIQESSSGGYAHVAHVEGQLTAESCLDLWLENILNGADSLALCCYKDGNIQVCLCT